MKNILLIAAITLSGCSTVTIQPDAKPKLSSNPTYEETKDFYFWGLSGEHTVDVKRVCGDKKVLQMQSQMTVENGLYGALTLGIYAPHSVKVWCGE